MRWVWIDRFLEFSSGSHARSIKCVSLAEEHLHDHFPAFPVMPPSLIVEGLAQTGGILVGEYQQFRTVVVLAKIPKIVFHGWAAPGDTLSYFVKVLDIKTDGGIVEATAHVGDRLIAEAEIVFASIAPSVTTNPEQGFAIPAQLLRVLNVGGSVESAAAPPSSSG